MPRPKRPPTADRHFQIEETNNGKDWTILDGNATTIGSNPFYFNNSI